VGKFDKLNDGQQASQIVDWPSHNMRAPKSPKWSLFSLSLCLFGAGQQVEVELDCGRQGAACSQFESGRAIGGSQKQKSRKAERS